MPKKIVVKVENGVIKDKRKIVKRADGNGYLIYLPKWLDINNSKEVTIIYDVNKKRLIINFE